MALQINKRLSRAVEYLEEDVKLFVPDNIGGWVLKAVVSRPEAHRWFHGNEHIEDSPEIAPTLDEMVDGVADKLKAEMRDYMEWALDNPQALNRMYSVARSGQKLTRAVW